MLFNCRFFSVGLPLTVEAFGYRALLLLSKHRLFQRAQVVNAGVVKAILSRQMHSQSHRQYRESIRGRSALKILTVPGPKIFHALRRVRNEFTRHNSVQIVLLARRHLKRINLGRPDSERKSPNALMNSMCLLRVLCKTFYIQQERKSPKTALLFY